VASSSPSVDTFLFLLPVSSPPSFSIQDENAFMWKYFLAHVREYSVTTEPYRSEGETRNAYKILASNLKGATTWKT
jgi:hypothetical protein